MHHSQTSLHQGGKHFKLILRDSGGCIGFKEQCLDLILLLLKIVIVCINLGAIFIEGLPLMSEKELIVAKGANLLNLTL